MQATLRKIDRDWYLEYFHSGFTAPVLIGIRWKILSARSAGYGAAAPLTDGMSFEYRAPIWTHYAGSGNYWHVQTEEQGDPLPDQPIPQPKVRKGIEVRYHAGRWEKYSQREGWIRA